MCNQFPKNIASQPLMLNIVSTQRQSCQNGFRNEIHVDVTEINYAILFFGNKKYSTIFDVNKFIVVHYFILYVKGQNKLFTYNMHMQHQMSQV